MQIKNIGFLKKKKEDNLHGGRFELYDGWFEERTDNTV